MNADEVFRRIRSNLGRKIVLSIVLTVGVWTTYLLLQRHPLFPVTVMQETWLDRIVPFLPGTVYLYESLWLLMPVAPWLMETKEELNGYTAGLVLVCLASFLIFLLHPTAFPRPKDLTEVNAFYGWVTRIDNELNAFPSLHAAFAVFHGACCDGVFSAGPGRRRVRGFFWIWALVIIAATLLTKQHVFVDAVAGAGLGLGGYAVGCRRTRMLPAMERTI
jgi:membrane-associated phospholipid phosphatase